MGARLMGTGAINYGITASYDADFDDSITVRYNYDHDSDITGPDQIPAMVTAAETASGSPIPRRRANLTGTYLYARQFKLTQDEEIKRRFYFDVTFSRPTSRALDGFFDQHPLNYPPVVTLSYMERERIIDRAKNVDGFTGGAARTAGTLGLITNPAGIPSQTPILDTERIPVIVINYNVASLASVLALNETYQDTTNDASITVFGNTFDARTLKYQGTDSADRREFEGQFYYPLETRIEIHKTTDVYIDSVGTQYINGTAEYLDININGHIVTEPVPIALDGTPGVPGAAISIGYRYLTEVSYTPLLGST